MFVRPWSHPPISILDPEIWTEIFERSDVFFLGQKAMDEVGWLLKKHTSTYAASSIND